MIVQSSTCENEQQGKRAEETNQGLFTHDLITYHEKHWYWFMTISLSSFFWAAAPKGRCPVRRRGEFPDVVPSVLLSFRPPLLAIKASNLPSKPSISPPSIFISQSRIHQVSTISVSEIN